MSGPSAPSFSLKNFLDEVMLGIRTRIFHSNFSDKQSFKVVVPGVGVRMDVFEADCELEK
jgi:hypothetical protein